jgi:hypothetical protein
MTVSSDSVLLLAQVMLGAALTGIIWLVQVVIYPQFLNVGAAEFSRYHFRHKLGITMIIVPLMLIEMGLACLAVWWFRQSSIALLSLVATLMTVGVWASTAFIQVPLHQALERERSESTICRLTNTNWIRTVLWSVRLVLLTWAMISWRGQ